MEFWDGIFLSEEIEITYMYIHWDFQYLGYQLRTLTVQG